MKSMELNIIKFPMETSDTSNSIQQIQFDRYKNETGVYYVWTYIVGLEYVYTFGKLSKCLFIFEEKYMGRLRYNIIFQDGAIISINDREDINVFRYAKEIQEPESKSESSGGVD